MIVCIFGWLYATSEGGMPLHVAVRICMQLWIVHVSVDGWIVVCNFKWLYATQDNCMQLFYDCMQPRMIVCNFGWLYATLDGCVQFWMIVYNFW